MPSQTISIYSKYFRWYFLRPGKIIGPASEQLLHSQVCLLKLNPDIFIQRIAELLNLNLNAVELKETMRCYYNSKPLHPNTKVKFPYKVEIYQAQAAEGIKAGSQEFTLPKCLIYEDENFCALYKPTGYPTLPLRSSNAISIKELLEDYLKKPAHFPSRLDTDTQGLLLASKSKQYHDVLQNVFVTRAISKTYLAKISQAITWQALTVAAPIGRSLKSPYLRSVWGHHGKSALTHFQKTTSKEQNIIIARPITGRTHQIRVHLKYLGHTIVGDSLYRYSDSVEPTECLNLICNNLKFLEPSSKKTIELSVPAALQPNWLTSS